MIATSPSPTSPSPTSPDRTIRVLDPVPEGIRILAVVVLLLSVGCFTLYSATSYRSLLEFEDPTHMWRGQLIKGYGIGLFCFMVGFLVRPRFWFEIGAIPMWVVVTGLLFASIFTPLGVRLNDANRWVQLMNIRFQPAELAKFAVPMATIALTGWWRFRQSWWRSDRNPGPEMSDFKGAIYVGVLVGIPFALTFVQPDFGTSLFILLLGMIPVFRWGKTLPYLFVPLILLGIVLSEKVIDRLAEMNERFLALFDPEKVDQVWAGLQAVGSGGAMGKGIGLAESKALYLPSEYSDFIFSVYAEETGFVGVLLLVVLYGVLLVSGWRLSKSVADPQLSCIVQVFTIAITAQATFNMMVNLALAPTKGIPLPFFSLGSTGLAVFMAMIGVLLAISRSEGREELVS